jgi:hypothetical protein
MLSKKQIFELFESYPKKQYQKRGRFLYRYALSGETVLTIVSGKLETLKTASDNDVLMMNIEIGSSAEKYIIADDVFKKRYNLVENKFLIDGQAWFEATAKGQIEAFMYTGSVIDLSFCLKFEFMAPWNELMLCLQYDYLARPLNGDKFDIYRIERDTFEKTYFLMEDK